MIHTLVLASVLALGCAGAASASDSAPAAIDPVQAAYARADAASERGLALLEQAREAAAPKAKHDAYVEAESLFKAARTSLEEVRSLAGARPGLEDRLAELNRWIYECRKSRPLSFG